MKMLEYGEKVKHRETEAPGVIVGFCPPYGGNMTAWGLEVLWDDGKRSVVKEDLLRRV